jgi:hypothetical protein
MHFTFCLYSGLIPGVTSTDLDDEIVGFYASDIILCEAISIIKQKASCLFNLSMGSSSWLAHTIC